MNEYEIASLAASTLALLAPYLKTVVTKAAETSAETIGEATAIAAKDKISRLYEMVRAKFAGKPEADRALAILKDQPMEIAAQREVYSHLSQELKEGQFKKLIAEQINQIEGADPQLKCSPTYVTVYGNVKNQVINTSTNADTITNNFS